MLTEWHVTPDYIVNNWTYELLDLMIEKLVFRKEKEIEMIQSDRILSSQSGDRIVSDIVLFSQLGDRLKVVKKSAD